MIKVNNKRNQKEQFTDTGENLGGPDSPIHKKSSDQMIYRGLGEGMPNEEIWSTYSSDGVDSEGNLDSLKIKIKEKEKFVKENSVKLI